MTRQQRGRKGGTTSGKRRTEAARLRMRERARRAVRLLPAEVRGVMVVRIEAGVLDAWLVDIERAGYRRGYAVRDETLRRETAAADQTQRVDAARQRFADAGAA